MPENNVTQEEENLDIIHQLLSTGEMQRVTDLLQSFHPAEIAHLLESLPQSKRTFLWNMLDHDDEGEILLHVGPKLVLTIY